MPHPGKLFPPASRGFSLTSICFDTGARSKETVSRMQISPATVSPIKQSKASHHAVLAGFLGWTLDAFDFFVVVFLLDTLAQQFGVTKKEIVLTTTATLAMRPLGALIFGLLSYRFGCRIPLLAIVIFFLFLLLFCLLF